VLVTLGGQSPPPSAARRNVDVERFADHDELFPRCDAVVTHAGLGTVLRALTHGVPLLMLPLGRDQLVNADRVAQLGAGIHLTRDAPTERIRLALEQLILGPAFCEAAAAAAARIAAGEPDRSAVQTVEMTVASPSVLRRRRPP
jgi:UDP:flavonoid glycosyltransferase YjiC (YdhE family)